MTALYHIQQLIYVHSQAITVDSQIVDNAPPREYGLPEREKEEFDDEEDFYAQLGEREDVHDEF